MANKQKTLKHYYSSFKSLSGTLACVVAGAPYISHFLPGDVGSYVFPPLGDVGAIGRFAVIMFAFATTFCIYFWPASSLENTSKRIVFAFLISALSFCVYFGLHLEFVRRVDIPSIHNSVYVSVGYKRTAFANATFGSASDEDILRARGMEDEQLRLLWTTKSLMIVRLALYIAYSASILALVVAFSFGVLAQNLKKE